MRVLLPVDSDEERAIAAAEAVLDIPHAEESVEVLLLNVQKEIEVTGGDGGKVSSSDWYKEDDFPESIQRAASVLSEAGIEVEKRRMHADPTEAILDEASDFQADRIVMAGRRRSPAGKVLFGSVTQSVLLNADIPVTVVVK